MRRLISRGGHLGCDLGLLLLGRLLDQLRALPGRLEVAGHHLLLLLLLV